jgi:hypothetical protein
VPLSPRASTVTWLALVALTLTSFTLSETSGVRAAVLPIMGAALVKVSLVGFQFMELRTAHGIWKTAFTALLALIVVVLLATRGS